MAEGIENTHESHKLQELGVPIGQGYFYAEPKPKPKPKFKFKGQLIGLMRQSVTRYAPTTVWTRRMRFARS